MRLVRRRADGAASVPGWGPKHRPQLRITTDGPADRLLPDVEQALRAEHLWVADRWPTGFEAKHRDWWSLVTEVNLLSRTEVRVDAEGRDLVVTVGFFESRPAERAICAALSSVVDHRRAAGHEVNVGAWTSQPKEDRQRRS